MANITLRFSMESDYNDMNFIGLKDYIPKGYESFILKDDPIILTNGKNTGRKYQKNMILFEYKFTNINSIKKCCSFWQKEWKEHINYFQSVNNQHKLNLYLLFVITVFDLDYPELVFDSKFLSILSENNINLSLYFYND